MAQLKSTTYDGLRALLDSKRDGYATIGHNTTAEAHAAGSILVRLHGHPIVRLHPGGQAHPDGWVEWTLAGHGTVTTRERVNQFLPPSRIVRQIDGGQFLARKRPGCPVDAVAVDSRAWYDQDGQEVSR